MTTSEVQETYRCQWRAGYEKGDCQCVLALADRQGHGHTGKHECVHGFQWFESWVSLAARHLDYVALAQALPVEGEAT